MLIYDQFFIEHTYVGVPDNITLAVNGNASMTDIMFGDSFNITCQPSCPTSLIIWRRNGTIISNSSSTVVNINRFSVEYITDNDGLVTRSVLTNNMAMFSDSTTYQCSSVVQGLETTEDITTVVYGKVYLTTVCDIAMML